MRKPVLRIILGAWLVLAGSALPGCDNDEPAELSYMTPAELNEALASKDFLLINVHVPYEGEIPGTDAHISYLELDSLVDYIGPELDTRVVLYCKSDHMSDIVGPQLVDRGYRAVYALTGGMNAWTNAGYPVDP